MVYSSLALFSLHVHSTDLFEDAVQLIKKYEGWHHARDQPYVGYGHRLLPTDTFNSDISESFADSLLRSDIKRNVPYSGTLGLIPFYLECLLLMSERVRFFAVNWFGSWKRVTGISKKSICLSGCTKARLSGLWNEDGKKNMNY